jgi:O-antigen ligase
VAVLLLLIPACYIALSMFAGLNINRISFILYGDSTLTGRTVIWDFALSEIARHPLLGWGYKSFWLVGSDAPSVVDAPAWVKQMPNSHNGYYDVMLELGYVGLALLVSFLITTLHALGRMADRDRTRAWIVLSLILFVIFYNFLESLWFRAFDLIWVVFVVLVAEAARYRQSEALIGSTDHRSRLSRTLPPLPSRWRRPPPRVQLLIGRGTTASSVRRN